MTVTPRARIFFWCGGALRSESRSAYCGISSPSAPRHRPICGEAKIITPGLGLSFLICLGDGACVRLCNEGATDIHCLQSRHAPGRSYGCARFCVVVPASGGFVVLVLGPSPLTIGKLCSGLLPPSEFVLHSISSRHFLQSLMERATSVAETMPAD